MTGKGMRGWAVGWAPLLSLPTPHLQFRRDGLGRVAGQNGADKADLVGDGADPVIGECVCVCACVCEERWRRAPNPLSPLLFSFLHESEEKKRKKKEGKKEKKKPSSAHHSSAKSPLYRCSSSWGVEAGEPSSGMRCLSLCVVCEVCERE